MAQRSVRGREDRGPFSMPFLQSFLIPPPLFFYFLVRCFLSPFFHPVLPSFCPFIFSLLLFPSVIKLPTMHQAVHDTLRMQRSENSWPADRLVNKFKYCSELKRCRHLPRTSHTVCETRGCRSELLGKGVVWTGSWSLPDSPVREGGRPSCQRREASGECGALCLHSKGKVNFNSFSENSAAVARLLSSLDPFWRQ